MAPVSVHSPPPLCLRAETTLTEFPEMDTAPRALPAADNGPPRRSLPSPPSSEIATFFHYRRRPIGQKLSLFHSSGPSYYRAPRNCLIPLHAHTNRRAIRVYCVRGFIFFFFCNFFFIITIIVIRNNNNNVYAAVFANIMRATDHRSICSVLYY